LIEKLPEVENEIEAQKTRSYNVLAEKFGLGNSTINQILRKNIGLLREILEGEE